MVNRVFLYLVYNNSEAMKSKLKVVYLLLALVPFTACKAQHFDPDRECYSFEELESIMSQQIANINDDMEFSKDEIVFFIRLYNMTELGMLDKHPSLKKILWEFHGTFDNKLRKKIVALYGFENIGSDSYYGNHYSKQLDLKLSVSPATKYRERDFINICKD